MRPANPRPPMDFVAELRPWTAATIAKTIGCPKRTVFAWRAKKKNRSSRLPPEWVQRLVIERMRGVPEDADET